MLALMPALCTCSADKRSGDSKRSFGFEPTAEMPIFRCVRSQHGYCCSRVFHYAAARRHKPVIDANRCKTETLKHQVAGKAEVFTGSPAGSKIT